jgi:Tyrosine phosphatase family
MTGNPPDFEIDRPLPWLHFRLTVTAWPPIIAMRQPSPGTRWQELKDLGIDQVLRLSEESQPYDPAPLRMLGMVAMEDQYEEEKPTDAALEELRLMEAVRLLREGLRHGGVVVHCVGGRGRTGTVIGAFLHSLGVPREAILERLNLAYQNAGRPGWPESPWQGEVVGKVRI